jgi:hypothetical protein
MEKTMKKLLMALLCCSALAHGEDGKDVDVLQFDIQGIKLGMNQEEALKILKEKFPGVETQEKQGDKEIVRVYGKEFTEEVNIQVNAESGTQLTINFLPNVLNNRPQELVVTAVKYQIPNRNEAILEKLRENAKAKYGKPTRESYGDYAWCEARSAYSCHTNNRPVLYIARPDDGSALLVLANKQLNKAVDKAAAEARKKEIEAKKAEERREVDKKVKIEL